MEKCAVLFDLDGTLLDTCADLVNAVNHMLREYGFDERGASEIKRFLGNGAADLVHRSLPEGVDGDIEKRFFDDYRAYYDAHSQIYTKPYEGVLELLGSLKRRGVKIAVVSNKPDVTVGGLCQKYFGDLVDLALGDRADICRKPSPEPLFYAMKALGCERAAYVGDSEVDVEAAKNAGLPCVSVTWGFREREILENCGASLYADNSEELERELLNILKN